MSKGLFGCRAGAPRAHRSLDKGEDSRIGMRVFHRPLSGCRRWNRAVVNRRTSAVARLSIAGNEPDRRRPKGWRGREGKVEIDRQMEIGLDGLTIDCISSTLIDNFPYSSAAQASQWLELVGWSERPKDLYDFLALVVNCTVVLAAKRTDYSGCCVVFFQDFSF